VQTSQVLKALASPNSAHAADDMRQAAAALFEDADSSRWLHTPLVPRLLSALRSLPGACSPKEAAQVCAAAVSALNNLLAGLPRPEDRARFRAQLAADSAACCALLHWGVLCPEAAEQLPPGQDVPWAYPSHSLSTGATGEGSWSTRAKCIAFIAVIAAYVAAPEIADLLRSFKEGVTPAVVACVLGVAEQHPGGTNPLLVDARLMLACLPALPCCW
jgi:hypothetical protein